MRLENKKGFMGIDPIIYWIMAAVFLIVVVLFYAGTLKDALFSTGDNIFNFLRPGK